MPESFIFDPVTHRYTLDGVVLPSVTQILRSAGIINYEWVAPEERERLMARGKAVHAACQFDDENDLDESTISTEIGGYLEGWRKFRRDARFVPDLIEYAGYNRSLRFAGTLDRTGYLRSSTNGNSGVLLDIKTGEAQWWVALQTAAYSTFFAHPGAFRRLSVELHQDGTYRLEEFRCADFTRDWRVFQAALVVHQAKVQLGGMK